MKTDRLPQLGVVAICALALGSSAFGLTKSAAQKNDVINYYQGFLLSSNITDSRVKNLQNEDIGTIENLIVNPETGRVRFAVLNVGSFLGNEDTKVVVPWIALNVEKTSDAGRPVYVLNTTKDKLKNAPRFDSAKLADLYNRTTAEPIFTYYEMIWIPDVSTSEEKSAKEKNKKATSATPNPSASTAASSHP